MTLTFTKSRATYDPREKRVIFTAMSGTQPVTCFVPVTVLEKTFGMTGRRPAADAALQIFQQNRVSCEHTAEQKYQGGPTVTLLSSDFDSGSAGGMLAED